MAAMLVVSALATPTPEVTAVASIQAGCTRGLIVFGNTTRRELPLPRTVEQLRARQGTGTRVEANAQTRATRW